jgi:hypothetical protein
MGQIGNDILVTANRTGTPCWIYCR